MSEPWAQHESTGRSRGRSSAMVAGELVTLGIAGARQLSRVF
jgi:hypothetical protein